MNAYLNYLLEASIGLCLFLLAYQILLRKETSFRFNRIFLLIGLGASVIFPLIKINPTNSPIPSLNLSVEPVVTEDHLVYSNEVIPPNSWTTWEIATLIYGIGLALFLLVFTFRLFKMFITLRKSSHYNLQNHHIVELKDTSSPFSFFNYIFIGNTPPLTDREKQQIIDHERIHAKLFHSVDIVLLNILGIVFWFNPVIRIYKKIFVQLHEFEADARAVETHDVNEYCNLLARVALHSADYRLANHFSNSLTVKRIEMMRTIKQKIKNWKMIAVAAFFPALFFAVSCQDQVESPAAVAEAGYPKSVQQAIDRLKAANPDVEFIVVPPTGPDLKDFEGKHAKHLSYIDGQAVIECEAALSIDAGKDENGNVIRYTIFTYNLARNKALPTQDQWKTASDVYEETIGRDKSSLIDGEPIFLTAEQSAAPKEGIKTFLKNLKAKVRYPEEAKRLGLKGKVFIKFVIKKDGTATNFEIIKGISKELDLEALRVLKAEIKGWNPATQNGKIVHSQFVLPVQFGD